MTSRVRIETRVGLIEPDDNRFLGRSVAEDHSRSTVSPSDLVAAALGAGTDPADREAFRLAALALTSPDARVWPLKLCRLMSAHGDPVVGFYASQLVCTGQFMGPGAIRMAALGLAHVMAHADDDASLEAAAVAWRERSGGRFGGFGVPFRAEDERLILLRGWVAGTPLAERPYWRLKVRLVAALAKHAPENPNVALGLATLFLDAGVAPEHCGLAGALMLTHVFTAHAVEAARLDGVMRELPPEVVAYAGAAPRTTSDRSPGDGVPAALRRHGGAAPRGNAYVEAGGTPAATTRGAS